MVTPVVPAPAPASTPAPARCSLPALRATPETAAAVDEALMVLYPDATCSLVYRDAYELLVATVLSAQTTDARVNTVTPALFASWPDAAAPHISYFISSMPSPGFNEMPPLSRVKPLPTSTMGAADLSAAPK